MKIGVIGDTHDNIPNIQKAVKIFKRKKVNFVIHTGDIISPSTVDYFKGLHLIFVQGNCDGDVEKIKEKVTEIGGKFFIGGFGEMEIGGKKIAITHKPTVIETILGAKYNYILYGHTHEQKVEKIGNVTLINPGSHYLGSNKKENCIVILDLLKNSIEIIKIPTKSTKRKPKQKQVKQELKP
ncbi:MAG: metallophosphoesterase [Candidatus Pacearchaeota archaeon]|nr:metallophosphoesterase [Candidatus Pacearchaeota archaeon]